MKMGLRKGRESDPINEEGGCSNGPILMENTVGCVEFGHGHQASP